MKSLLETVRLMSLSGPVLESGGDAKSKRRSCLPAPCPNASNISLWNILRNNIGKDLSKVAMPVELNEPLNTLQRLCEELEYSELLDKAAQVPSALERMVRSHSSGCAVRPLLRSHPAPRGGPGKAKTGRVRAPRLLWFSFGLSLKWVHFSPTSSSPVPGYFQSPR